MIVFRTQIAVHTTLTRKEGRYMTLQQASCALASIGEALGLTQYQSELAFDFLRGKLSLVDFTHKWSGSPAEQDSVIGLLLWFSLQPCSEHVSPKGAYVVFSNNTQSLCDRSVVFTTRRVIPLSPITKDLISLGYARGQCTEMYVDYMREMYPHGFI